MERRGWGASTEKNGSGGKLLQHIKNELIRHRQFQNQAEAHYDIAEYIQRVYNRQRLHQALGYRSPEEFEKMAGES